MGRRLCSKGGRFPGPTAGVDDWNGLTAEPRFLPGAVAVSFLICLPPRKDYPQGATVGSRRTLTLLFSSFLLIARKNRGGAQTGGRRDPARRRAAGHTGRGRPPLRRRTVARGSLAVLPVPPKAVGGVRGSGCDGGGVSGVGREPRRRRRTRTRGRGRERRARVRQRQRGGRDAASTRRFRGALKYQVLL